MNRELESVASKLDGYLLAIADLKDDGTFFACHYLGAANPAGSLDLLCRVLKIAPDDVQLTEPELHFTSGLPTQLKQWIMQRRRVINADDSNAIDERLYDGFKEALKDLLGRTITWRQLRRNNGGKSADRLGPIWDVFIVGTEDCAYAIHCSWDS